MDEAKNVKHVRLMITLCVFNLSTVTLKIHPEINSAMLRGKQLCPMASVNNVMCFI